MGHGPFALLHTAAPYRPGLASTSYIAVEPDQTSFAPDPFADDPCLGQPGPFAEVPRWVGVLPYEACRGNERRRWAGEERRPAPSLVRPEWHRFRGIVRVDHVAGRVHVITDERDRTLASSLAQRLTTSRGLPPRAALRVQVDSSEAPSLHIERVMAAKELIVAGDLYQVNMARALRLRTTGSAPSSSGLLALYERLVAASPTAFASFMALSNERWVLSTSPELLLRAHVEPGSSRWSALTTIPIKGTRPRGADAEHDLRLARELDADPKERAELAMIVDVERNDLHRVACPGQVRLVAGPEVVRHRTVFHREAVLSARTRVDASRADVLGAMVPSGSVTGAPKVRAMEVIATLEAARRGLYTGGLGYVGHDGALTLAMAIRTAVMHGDEGSYFTGGGIVAGSDPARELAETEWKALQLRRIAEAGG